MHGPLNIKCIRVLYMINALTLFTWKGHMMGQELKVLNSQNRRRHASGCFYISHFFQWRYSPTGLWPTERPPPVNEASANFCG